MADLQKDGHIRIGRGNVISKKDLAECPGDYPVYSSSANGVGEFGRYGKFMFDDERITWSIDGGGKFFYRTPHQYSVTNVSGWIKVDSRSIHPKFLFHVLSAQWAKLKFDYTLKAHPSVIKELYRIPILSVSEQERIVRVLDSFESLTQD